MEPTPTPLQIITSDDPRIIIADCTDDAETVAIISGDGEREQAYASLIVQAVNSHERALHLLDLCRKLPNIPLEVRHDIESFIQKMHPVQEMPPL